MSSRKRGRHARTVSSFSAFLKLSVRVEASIDIGLGVRVQASIRIVGVRVGNDNANGHCNNGGKTCHTFRFLLKLYAHKKCLIFSFVSRARRLPCISCTSHRKGEPRQFFRSDLFVHNTETAQSFGAPERTSLLFQTTRMAHLGSPDPGGVFFK